MMLSTIEQGIWTIEMPFTIDYFGGWDKAYPDVIEQSFGTRCREGSKANP